MPELKKSNETLVILTYLSSLFCPILPSLIVLLASEPDTTLKLASKQSFGLQITLLIYGIVSTILLILLAILSYRLPLLSFLLISIVILVLLAIGITGFVMTIVGAVKSSDNPEYKYPKFFNLFF
jgi:uncharacterized protein